MRPCLGGGRVPCVAQNPRMSEFLHTADRAALHFIATCRHPARVFSHADSFRRFLRARGALRSAMNIRATPAQPPRPRYLMCRPQHFAVTYSINPWMDPKAWADSGDALHATAARQWAGLHRALLCHGALIEQVEPAPDLPDLVFTANAAVVLTVALLARFRHPERQREQPVYAQSFRACRRAA